MKKFIKSWGLFILYIISIIILTIVKEYDCKCENIRIIKAMEENRLEIITETRTTILPNGTRIEKVDTVDYRIIVKK